MAVAAVEAVAEAAVVVEEGEVVVAEALLRPTSPKFPSPFIPTQRPMEMDQGHSMVTEHAPTTSSMKSNNTYVSTVMSQVSTLRIAKWHTPSPMCNVTAGMSSRV